MIENYTEEKLIEMLDNFLSRYVKHPTTPPGYLYPLLDWVEKHRLCVQDVERAIDRMALENYQLKNGLTMYQGPMKEVVYPSEEYENSIISGNLQCIKPKEKSDLKSES